MEAKLLDRLDMVQTHGKQNKRVPVLFTPDMKRSIDNLVTHRDAVGIKADNKYLFATAAEGHLDSWQVLQNTAKTAGCKQRNLISSTRLRKYIATVCQVCITSTHLMHLVFITISFSKPNVLKHCFYDVLFFTLMYNFHQCLLRIYLQMLHILCVLMCYT